MEVIKTYVGSLFMCLIYGYALKYYPLDNAPEYQLLLTFAFVPAFNTAAVLLTSLVLWLYAIGWMIAGLVSLGANLV